jgi:hypothetical protein
MRDFGERVKMAFRKVHFGGAVIVDERADSVIVVQPMEKRKRQVFEVR